MLIVGRRKLKKQEMIELLEVLKGLHKWNEKYNKDKKEKYLDICHIEDAWMVHTSSDTGKNYLDYAFYDAEIMEGAEDGIN